MTESLWRAVEELVLSVAEGTSAMLVNRCSSELSGHQNHEKKSKSHSHDGMTKERAMVP